MSADSDRSNDFEVNTDNTATRVHCVLVVDVSESMLKGDAIGEVNRGIAALKKDILDNDRAKDSVEVMLVTFGGTAQVVHGFGHISEFNPPTLIAEGGTPLGEALQLAYERLQERKEDARNQGVGVYNRSWVFLMTDGEPNSRSPWETWSRKFHQYQIDRGCWFYAFGVGKVNETIMRTLTPPGEPTYKLDANPGAFSKLLKFASASLTGAQANQKPVLVQNPCA